MLYAAEAESGAAERGINHLDEEDRRIDERVAKNRTVETVAGWSRGNDTAALEEITPVFATEYASSTKDSSSLVIAVEAHSENTSGKYVEDQVVIFASKKIEEPEQAEEAVLEHEDARSTNESTVEKPRDDWLTVMSVEKVEDVTEARYGEQRNVEDIKAISFQVPPPPPDEKEEDYQDSRQQGKTGVGRMNETTRKLGEGKKDQSRPTNNLLTGKSTKAFYEIKPSIRTLETDRGREYQLQTTTHRTPGKKFLLPGMDSGFGKFGPYFEDGDRETNVSARIGSVVLLDCKIGMLGNREVSPSPCLSLVSLVLPSVAARCRGVRGGGREHRIIAKWKLESCYNFTIDDIARQTGGL